MITKPRGLIAAGMLAGALLLGTAGFAVAQDPNTTPTPSPYESGAGMIGGRSGSLGMTGGQMGSGMMSPELFAQMDAMHDQVVASSGAGIAPMDAMHDQVVASGGAGIAQMDAMHDQPRMNH